MRPVLFIIFSFLSLSAMAQLQNNNWCFGKGAGLNFNTNPPTSFGSSINRSEGVATVSHAQTGDLLFYANTRDVYNRNGIVMANGNGIGTDMVGTCAQGVVIVPFVNDRNKYYVFTLDYEGSSGVLAYSVVDMTLDAGRGGVVNGQKRVPIDSAFGETMIVSESCGWYWLITFKKHTQDFYAYHITANGINTTPVVSATTGYTNRCAGIATMKMSPDKTKLGLAVYQSTDNVSFVAIHDFDQSTGIVSNGMVIDTEPGWEFYGCEFSPNSQRYYAVAFTSNAINQYDLSLSTAVQISASKKTVGNTQGGISNIGQLQMGPDSNIYFSRYGVGYLGCIYNSNLVFPACSVATYAIPLNANTSGYLGLPQAVVLPYPVTSDSSTVGTRTDITICANDHIVLRGRANGGWYQWQDNSTIDSFVVTEQGTYWVMMPDSCMVFADTFVVSYYPDTLSKRFDTSICDGVTLMLHGRSGQASYLWQDSSTASSISTDTSGIFWVQMNNECYTYADTFMVTTYTDSFFSSVDSLICDGARIAIRPVADRKSNATYKWNTGESVYSIFKGIEGVYWVTTTEHCVVTTDTIVVKEMPLEVDAGVDTVICMGDEITLVGSSTPATQNVAWNTGEKTHAIKVKEEGYYTFTASSSGCTVSDKVFVDVLQDLTFDLGSDTEICRNDRYILPLLSSIDSATFIWQDGSNNRKYIVEESGRYTLTVNNKCGTRSDTVDILVRDCNLFFPSAFTPNGDGLNDIARFVGDVSNVKDFVLRIFNRRGQEVYVSTNVNDGWDGTHNGQPAAMTTYYYYIKYTYMGKEHLDKGDLTLIR